MEESPLVSIVMPVYNAEKYIAEAIDSMLNQTYTNIELLLIIDAPTDNTLSIIDHYTDKRIIKLINEQNSGIAFSTNRALNIAQGTYIAFMDDDDVSPLDRLEVEVEYLENHKEYDLVGGAHCQMDANGNSLTFPLEQKRNPKYIKAYYLFGEVGIYNGTFMIRKGFLDKFSIRCRENCYGMQDLQFYMECSKYGEITTLRKLMLYHRIHENNACEIGMIKYTDNRKKAYAEFQKQSLEMSGYHIGKDDMEFINSVLTEYKEDHCKSMEEIIRLRNIFRDILKQGKVMKIDYYDELEIVCRDLLAKQIRRMSL